MISLVFNIEQTLEFVKETIGFCPDRESRSRGRLARAKEETIHMLVQMGRLDAADKKTRNRQPRDRATILALMAGVLWGLGLLQYALRHVVER